MVGENEEPRTTIGELLALKLTVAVLLRLSPEREAVMSTLHALRARQTGDEDPLGANEALGHLLEFLERIAQP